MYVITNALQQILYIYTLKDKVLCVFNLLHISFAYKANVNIKELDALISNIGRLEHTISFHHSDFQDMSRRNKSLELQGE